jgi:hypothetical protein
MRHEFGHGDFAWRPRGYTDRMTRLSQTGLSGLLLALPGDAEVPNRCQGSKATRTPLHILIFALAVQHPLRARVWVVAPTAQPLFPAEDELVRRPATAIVLRWLLVAADSVPDGPHLAMMLDQVNSPPVLDVNGPYRHSQSCCDLRMLGEESPIVSAGPRRGATAVNKRVLSDQEPASWFLGDENVSDLWACVHLFRLLWRPLPE